jgi:hypothetical protein
MKLNVTEVIHNVAAVSFVASIVANTLPKADIFASYPKIQRAYETFFVKFVSALAVNLRFRTPSLDLSIPGYGLTKPPGSLPAASVEEIAAGESKPGPVHPEEEAPKS